MSSYGKIKSGTFFSYLVILINLLISFLFIPWFSKTIGTSNYALYTLANSVAGIFILDLGLSATSAKYLSKYRATNDKESEIKFISIITKIYLVIDIFIFVAMFVIFIFLGNVYSGLTPTELESFKGIFLAVGLYSLISLPLTTTNGILTANQDFAVLKLFSLIQKIMSVGLMSLSVVFGFDILYIIIINLGVTVFISVFKWIYCKKKYALKLNFKLWDKQIIIGIFKFSFWIMIMTLCQRITVNLIPTILGSISNSEEVAIYGFAIVIEEYAFTFTTAISGLFLPKLTKIEETESEENKKRQLTNIFIFTGKIQSILILLIFTGFILFGRQFVITLMGAEYSKAYICICLLIVPNLLLAPKLPMESHSYVKNTIKHSAIIRLCFSVVIIILSFLLGGIFGSIGISVVFGVGMFLCYFANDLIVYWKKQKIDIPHFYLHVHLKSWLISLVTFGLFFVITLFIPIDNLIFYVIVIVTYSLVFVGVNFYFLFDRIERRSVFNMLLSPFLVRVFANKKVLTTIKSFLLYSLIFIVILSLETPYTSLNIYFVMAVCIVSFLHFFFLSFPMFLKFRNFVKFYYIRNISLIFITIFIFSSIVTYCLNGFGHISFYAKYILVLLSAYFISQTYSLKEIGKAFCKIFSIIVFSSLIIFMITTISGVQFGSYVFINDHFYFTYFPFGAFLTSQLGKNHSIFWEPGIFATYCLLAFILTKFCFKNIRVKAGLYTLFSMGIITSGSVAGYLLLGLTLLLFIPKKYTISKVISRISFSLLCFALIAIYLIPYLPQSIVESIIYIGNTYLGKGVSLITRLFSIKIDIQMLIDNFPFGAGSNYTDYFQSLVTSFGYSTIIDSSVSTFGFFLGSFGIIGFLLFVITVGACFCEENITVFTKSLLTLILFLIFSKEPHQSSIIFYVFIFGLYREFDVKYLRKDVNHIYTNTILYRIKTYCVESITIKELRKEKYFEVSI